MNLKISTSLITMACAASTSVAFAQPGAGWQPNDISEPPETKGVRVIDFIIL